MNQYKRVCFVCTGNICRSPAAAMILKSLLPPNAPLTVTSAALSQTTSGRSMNKHVVAALHRHNIRVTEHRATHLTPTLFSVQDLVLCMTNKHFLTLQNPPYAQQQYPPSILDVVSNDEQHQPIVNHLLSFRSSDLPYLTTIKDPNFTTNAHAHDHIIEILIDACTNLKHILLHFD